MRCRVLALALAAALTASAPAWADTHGDAVKAFEKGRKLRDANELDKAVHVFEQSIALEPSIGAYFNLGLIHSQQGHPRAAVDAFGAAERLAREKGDAREKDASKERAKVLAAHNHVTLKVPDDVARAPGLTLVLDGEVVPQAEYNGPVFRSKASHELRVSAAGRQDLRIQPRNNGVIKVELGEPVASGASPSAPAPATHETPETAATGVGGWGWQKWTGVGLVGVGLAGIAVSLVRVFGYLAEESDLDKARAEASTRCTTNSDGTIEQCAGSTTSEEYQRASKAVADYNQNEQDAKDGAPLTVTAGVAGLLLVGGGVALFLTAPSTEAASPAASSARVRLVPRVGPRESGLSVVGTF